MLKFDPDDVELETALQIKSHDLPWLSTEALEEPASPSPPTFLDTNHGFTRDKRTACCAMNSPGLVDCQGCLDGEIERVSDYLDEAEKVYVLEIVSLLNDAGPYGIGKRDVLVSLGTIHSLRDLIPSIFVGLPTGTGHRRRVQCDRQSELTSHPPVLLGGVLDRRPGVISLPPDMESCRTQVVGHGEA